MRIIFVRHGNPNYELDCLTELGHVQAAAAAERLAPEGIEKIYSSTCGRAMETAGYTAKKTGLDVHPCDFIREIDWGVKEEISPIYDGNPWDRAERFIKGGECPSAPDWRANTLFAETKTPESLNKLGDGLDDWLKTLGYTREGYCYRVGKVEHKTVAMFCHGGAFAAAISHLFSVPMPFSLMCIPFNQSGIVEIMLSGREGELAIPQIHKVHNVQHLIDKSIKIT